MCLQCHSPSMNFTAPGIPSFHNQANQYQACTPGAAQIHGLHKQHSVFIVRDERIFVRLSAAELPASCSASICRYLSHRCLRGRRSCCARGSATASGKGFNGYRSSTDLGVTSQLTR